MIFGLGILTGIIICSFIIIIEIWLSNRNIGGNKLRTILEQQLNPPAHILKPKSQKEKDIQKLISNNEKRGVDTPLEDLCE